MNYSQFRTGLTFQAVRDELMGEQAAARELGEYMFVSRATVLGRWHEIKLSMWASIPQSERGSEHE